MSTATRLLVVACVFAAALAAGCENGAACSAPKVAGGENTAACATPKATDCGSRSACATPKAAECSSGSACATPKAAECNSRSACSTSKAACLDLVDTAVSTGNFNTLVAAVKEAGLVETLKGPGPFTVFAPTDEAFAKLPHGALDNLLANPDQLKEVLLFHVVPGKVLAADVVNLDQAVTAGGKLLPVHVSHGNVFVGEAKVVATDVKASNGVIHVIDTVLLP